MLFTARKGRLLPVHSLAVSNTLTRYAPAERMCFEWFIGRTIKKIPGPFALKFWDKLLIQASLQDAAVMHAVLSLGFVHKSGVEREAGKETAFEEQLSLHHYCKAIGQLQPHFASKDKTSLRTTLITCIVFISLEYLRGHFLTAECHIANGLKILRALEECGDSGGPMSRGNLNSADNWIRQAFSRICFQTALLKPSSDFEPFKRRGEESLPTIFRTTDEAWVEIEGLLYDTLQLKNHARLQWKTENLFDPGLQRKQNEIHSNLAQWLKAFQQSSCEFRVLQELPMVVRLLYSYHAMARIMAATCLLQDETAYDEHIEDFRDLVKHCNAMWQFRESNPMTRPPLIQKMSMAHSMVDIGWIPPLFYTALKCRVLSIRAHAIRLIQFGSHREGVWDSRIAAHVARKVVELEGGAFDDHSLQGGGTPLNQPPPVSDLLPTDFRISEIDIVLPDDENGVVALYYKREYESGSWEQARIQVGNT
jgi:hypothetical protein